jgi:hypothetical protein
MLSSLRSKVCLHSGHTSILVHKTLDNTTRRYLLLPSRSPDRRCCKLPLVDARKSGHEFVASRISSRLHFIYTIPHSTVAPFIIRYDPYPKSTILSPSGKRRGRTGVRTQVPGILRSTRCLFQKPMCSPLHYTTVVDNNGAKSVYVRRSNSPDSLQSAS